MYQWQDFVFSVGALIFVIALIPSLRSNDKPALSTSLVTGTVLFIFAISYLTLSLWFSAATTALTSACWLALAYQKAVQQKKLQK